MQMPKVNTVVIIVSAWRDSQSMSGESVNYIEKKLTLKFIYSEKATKFCEISTVDLTITT